jgi:hypothetical protein
MSTTAAASDHWTSTQITRSGVVPMAMLVTSAPHCKAARLDVRPRIYASYAAQARDGVVAACLYLSAAWTGDLAVATRKWRVR